MTDTDFKTAVLDAIAAQLNATDYLNTDQAAELAAAITVKLEPVFADGPGHSKIKETLGDVGDIVAGGFRDAQAGVADALKADGPIVTGATEGLSKMQQFLKDKAAEARKKTSGKGDAAE